MGERRFSPEQLGVMTAAIAHRGPDDRGAHLAPGIALGACRLAIRDPKGGHQPIGNESGTVWASVNGELFDYEQIRGELIAAGHQLATRCDTEAWVHLYEDRGVDALAAARGQFALALWDQRKRTLILARDRVGICPLFYAERDGWLLWGSEVKALLASGLVPARPDLRGIDQLFSTLAAPPERTFFEGVRAVPPGHYLRVTRDAVTLHRYWDLDFPARGEERRGQPGPLVDELEAHLLTAVRRRVATGTGRRIASYLSGGVDSSLVLAMAGQLTDAPPHAFTVGLNHAGPDESALSAATAARAGTELATLMLDQRAIVDAFPELIRAAEGPVLDTSNACLLRLAQSVKAAGYDVVLSGEGADEAFAGYAWYKAQRALAAVDRLGASALTSALRRLATRAISAAHREPFPEPLGGLRPGQLEVHLAMRAGRSRLYSADMWSAVGDFNPYAELKLPLERMRRWDPLNQSLYFDYQVMLPGHLLLGKGDRVSMNASVEARYPFLDEDVISFAATLAPEHKLRGLTEKWLLREVARRHLPTPVALRPKSMFQATLSHSLLGPHRPRWIDQLISPESLRKVGVFDAGLVEHERRAQRLPRLTPARWVTDAGLVGVVSTQLFHHLFFGADLCELSAWRPPSAPV